MRRQPTTPCLPACAHRHSHTRQSPRAVLLTAGLLAFALWPSTVQAWDLTMSLANLTGPTAGSGTFEVLLTNTGPSVAVAAFSFEVTVDPSSGVQFAGATTETVSAPYIFEDNSLFSPSLLLIVFIRIAQGNHSINLLIIWDTNHILETGIPFHGFNGHTDKAASQNHAMSTQEYVLRRQ